MALATNISEAKASKSDFQPEADPPLEKKVGRSSFWTVWRKFILS
ncbi:MAG: hypothetical protein V1825_00980 [Candidatus Falkowbacteria bacterium]